MLQTVLFGTTTAINLSTQHILNSQLIIQNMLLLYSVMTRFVHLCLPLLALLFLSCQGNTPDDNTPSKVPAFPGAEGGGMYATGGRGAMVYHVTNLEDNATTPGCLRYVLGVPGAKTVVFDVAGVIHLKRELDITEGSITIAGQTAPGDGICIAGAPVVIKSSNVIIRFLRFRMGDGLKLEGDALTCIRRNNVIIDHCSFSWSTDECVSCYGNNNFTLQYCFITESLRNSVHLKGGHGYAGIWGGTNASFHHNLIAHHDSRNPRFDHDYVEDVHRGPIDFVNNVIYNWGGNSAYGGESVDAQRTINFVGNYYKPGPATNSKVRTRLVNPWTSCTNCSNKASGTVMPPKIYLVDNVMYGSDEVTADNWKGSTESSKSVSIEHFAMNYGVNTQSANEAYETVLQHAGASIVRDAIDTRIVNEVREGKYTYKGSNGSTNGLIDSQSDVGGWPTYSGTPATDTDKDGMPDEWESQNGLNPNSYNDGALYTLDNNYTNLEVYINSLAENVW